MKMVADKIGEEGISDEKEWKDKICYMRGSWLQLIPHLEVQLHNFCDCSANVMTRLIDMNWDRMAT